MFFKWSLGALCAFLALSSFPLSPVAHADTTWREVRSPHFHVLTDSSEKDGRRVAFQFEQMRRVFAVLFHQEEFESGAPLTIVAAKNADTFQLLEPALWKLNGDKVAGEFHRGWEKQFAIIRLDTFEGQNQTVVYHEYTHSILHANFLWLPTWLDEGLAEFYAYTHLDGKKVYVGMPSTRMQHYGRSNPYKVEQMLNTRGTSGFSPHDGDLFYLQAWAMVHYMMFGEGMEGGRKLMTFITKLEQEEPQEKAFVEVFGPLKSFSLGLDSHLRLPAVPNGILPMDSMPDASTYTASTLTPAQTDYELGCYALGTRDRKRGKQLMEEALKLDPSLAGAHEELGYLNFEEGNTEAARAEWTRARTLDDKLPRSAYALAMTTKPLTQQTPGELNRTQTALQKVTSLAPRFAPAYVELAMAEWRLSQLRQAYIDAGKAERLEPSRAGYRLLTARLLLQANRPEVAAQEAAYVAGHWFGPDHNEAVELLQSIPPVFRKDIPEQKLEVPADAKLLRGTLVSSSCQEGQANRLSVRVQPDDSTRPVLTLTVDGPFQQGWSDTLWWGSDHMTPCQNVSGRAVLVAYKPVAEGGTMKDLEVRDDIPVEFPAPSATPAAPALKASSP